MTSLREQLERLGLSQYFEIFVTEGFDTWETVLDVTESDLTALHVKLGHRRKLQRAIAEARGQPPERALSIDGGKLFGADGIDRSDDSGGEASKDGLGGRALAAPSGASAAGMKRKYRRHPKTDETAPERPPSAYVIFSNQVREELKGQDLSFTEIAKLVGERWQVLSPDIRDTFERQAAAAKEHYYNELSKYKKTAQYQQYQQYLADFKSKHNHPGAEGKRSRHGTSTPSEVIGHTRSSGDRPVESPNMVDRSSPGHLRSLSSTYPKDSSFGAPSGYRVPTSSSSPATFSGGMPAPITQHTHSPKSSPPNSKSIYGIYDLPHHARSSGESSLKESGSSGSFSPVSHPSPWRTQSEDQRAATPTASQLTSRRPLRTSSPMPSLIHTDSTYGDTSHSSYGETLPELPYKRSLLPLIDAPKADRTLPQPVLSAHSQVSSPLDARPLVPLHAKHTSQSHTHDLDEGTQWPALLRATALARDAEDQNDQSPRE